MKSATHRRLLSPARALALLAGLALLPLGAWGQVHLTTATMPPTGLAGSGSAYLTGTGFPSGVSAANTIVSFAATCQGTVLATAAATSIQHVFGSTDRVHFAIPGSLATGTYAVWATSSSPAFASTSCSTLQVTNTTRTLEACIPSSSMAVQVGANVTAYVPDGYWDSETTGIQVVPIEGGGAPVTVPTANSVNACSSNAITGQTVCTANNTDIYLLSGQTLTTTLTSSADSNAGFSGGNCENCGVAIDAANNTAIIEEGNSTAASGSAFQVLNLASNTLLPPLPLAQETSENISVDPLRNYILSPNENNNYDLVTIGNAPGFALTEFTGGATVNSVLDSSAGGEADSAAEDCSTGIGLSSLEFTKSVFVTDVSQAVFTPGGPGTWDAPSSILTMNTDYAFSAGTSGISVAPGSTHLGVVTGEFGGNTFAVLQLPSTGGSGTPTIADYAVAQIPYSITCGGTFSAGQDPHTITAYTSPNDGKAYAVFAGYGYTSLGYAPICLARVDLAAVLAAPRGGGGTLQPNDVAASDFPATAVTFYPVR